MFYAGIHQKRELMELLEKQIVTKLEKDYLIDAHCSACNKVIINKTKLI